MLTLGREGMQSNSVFRSSIPTVPLNAVSFFILALVKRVHFSRTGLLCPGSALSVCHDQSTKAHLALSFCSACAARKQVKQTVTCRCDLAFGHLHLPECFARVDVGERRLPATTSGRSLRPVLFALVLSLQESGDRPSRASITIRTWSVV